MSSRFSEITDTTLRALVERFYTAVQADALIGPVFAAKVEDWEHHYATLTNFWSSMMLGSGRYQGRPLPLHMALPLEDVMFERWLELFRAAAMELFEEGPAAQLIARAERIAASFQ